MSVIRKLENPFVALIILCVDCKGSYHVCDYENREHVIFNSIVDAYVEYWRRIDIASANHSYQELKESQVD